jgi:hypothetical protein
MENDTNAIATSVLHLMKKSIKRIYALLIIFIFLFIVSIVDSIYQRCRIIDLTKQYKIVEHTIDEACELEHRK